MVSDMGTTMRSPVMKYFLRLFFIEWVYGLRLVYGLYRIYTP